MIDVRTRALSDGRDLGDPLAGGVRGSEQALRDRVLAQMLGGPACVPIPDKML